MDIKRTFRVNPVLGAAVLFIALGASSIGLSSVFTRAQGSIPAACTDDNAIVGTPDDDKLKGTKFDDVIFGGGGDDVIKGKGGNDLICARGGEDFVKGGNGDDTIYGGGADDELRGGPGDDTIKGGPGTDTADGGADTDDCDAESETNCEEPATPTPTPTATPTPTPTATPTATATATPTATPTNPPHNLKPAAGNDTYATDEDQPLSVPAPGVLANDSDPESGLTGAQLLTNPANGDVTFNPNGSFAYTPDANFNGPDTFTYAAKDNIQQSDPATVTINVAPVPDIPTAIAQSVAAGEDSPEVITLAGTDTDGPAPSIFKITSLPDHGVLRNGSGLAGQQINAGDLPYTLSGNTVTYLSDPNYFGPDDFDFKANDGSSDSPAATVSLNVAPANDAPTDISLSNNSVDEELASGATVGNLSATDIDPGDAHTFTLVSGAGDTDNSRFSITNGVLKTAEVFDFETQGPFSIRVRATDTGPAFFEKQFTVTLNNVNDAPVVTGGTLSVSENAPNGTILGAPSVADQDAGQNHTWSITGGNSGNAFAIDTNTGQITVADSNELDFEDVQQFLLTVRAVDNGSPAKDDTDTLTINLTNVNEAPTDITLSNASVAENEAAGATVGNLGPIDPDAGDTHTLTLVSGIGDGDNGKFQIASGVLQTAQGFDFETQGPFSIRIRARDAGNLDYEEVFSISVTNVNDAPVINDTTFNLDENSPNNTVVGTQAATDEDSPAQTLTYSITGGNTGDAFQINASTGQITVADVSDVDFETNPTFGLIVQVVDDGTPAKNDTATITVNLNNLNENPVVNAATLSLAENSANGTSVGTVTSSDPDVGDTVTYAITGGNTGGAFQINSSTGEITVADVNDVDFETNHPFSLTVQATDSGTGNLTGSNTVTVNLTNVNESPTDISLNDTDVAENASLNTVVGTISGSDPDAGDAAGLVFSLAAGAGDTDNARFNVGPSNSLRTSEAFDKETQGPFSIRLRATDGGNLQYEEVFQIDVLNVNEAPNVNANTFAIDEKSANGTAVGTATATDPDAGTVLTWAITGGNTGGAFAIDSSTGAITVADTADVDFETNHPFALTVQAADNGTPQLSDSDTITVNLNDVNDNPVVNAAIFSLAENSANGTSAGTPTATDQDTPLTPQTLTWAITGGNTGGAFQINPSTGEITVADAADVDFETNHPFSLTVEATDNGTPNRSGSNTVTVNLTNVNEAPVITAPATVNAQYNVAKAISGISVADPDAGSNAVVMTMSVLDGTLSLDTSVLNGLVAGDVTGNGSDVLAIGGSLTKINNTLGAANGLTYTSDSGFSGLSDTLAILVNDGGASGSGVPQSDTENVTILFNTPPVATAQTVTTNEDTEKTVTLAGTDADADPLTFKITALPAAGKLHEGNSSAGTEITTVPHALPGTNVTYVPPLNQNGAGLETFGFKAHDGSVDSAQALVTVDVTAINDAPILGNTGANLAYDENDPPTAITTDLALADIDTPMMTGATVQITGNYANGQDVLAYPGGFSITAPGGFNAATGTLTLTGTTTLANYLSALEAVTYENTSHNPSELTRTVTFTIDDGALQDTATAGIDVTEINDLPAVATPGADLSYTENDAATAIHSTMTVTDLDHTNATGATVQITGNYANGQDVLSFVNTPNITGNWTPANGTMTLSGTTTFANYEAALQAVKYHNTSENPSSLTRTVTYSVNDGEGNGTDTHGITVTPVNDAPIANTNTLNNLKSALANTTLDNGVSSAEPIHIDTASNEDIDADDFDHEGDAFSLVAGADCVGASAPFTCTTDGHDPDGPGGNAPLTGTVTLHANGLFEYDPPAGFIGTDSFQYRVSDGQLVNPTSDGTVNINVVGPLVWYVDDSAPGGGNGTSSSMYQTLTPLTGGTDLDGTGDRIFVHAGTYTAGITLENNQKLIGEPNGFSVNDTLSRTHNLLAAGGTAPAISHAANTVVTLGQNNELQDLALGNGTISLAGTGIGTTGQVRDTSISNAGGKALDINGGTMDMVFSTLTSSNSTTEAVKLNNAAGSLTANGGTLSTAANTLVDINGATQDVSFAGNMSDLSGKVVSITNTTGGTKDFNGTVTGAAGGSGPRIDLTSNTGSIIRFDNDLSLSTSGLPAFNATGGGTIHVTSDDNILTTTTGTPLNVVNTTIGAGDLIFDSISSNGAANGIVLDNTGNSGNLEVTGSPAADTNDGGTIANTAGSDAATSACASPAGTPPGVGIFLRSTTGPIFNDMLINASSNFGLRAHDVVGFTMDDSTFSGTHGNNDTQDEGTATFCNLTGSATISDSVIGGGFEDSLKLTNTGGTLNRLTVSNTDFATSTSNKADDAFEASSTGSGTMNVTVNGGSAFTTAAGDHLQYSVAGTGSGDLVVQNNAFSNNYPTPLGGGITVNPGGNGSNVNVTYNLSGNTIRDSVVPPITVTTGGLGSSGTTGTYSGTIANNQTGVTGVNASGGSASSSGISFHHMGNGTHTVSITGNTVKQYTLAGIRLLANGGNPTVRATVKGNVVNEPSGPNVFAGISVEPGSNISTVNMCLDLGGLAVADKNSASTSDPANAADILLFPDGASTLNLPGYVGPANGAGATAAVVPFVTTRNNGDGVPAVLINDVAPVQYTGTGTNCL